MTSPSKHCHKTSGFSLFEALVSLTILSLVLAVTVAAVRTPSPALQARADIADLMREAEVLRLQAIKTAKPVDWSPAEQLCDAGRQSNFKFFPDGTGAGPDLCIASSRLRVHPLSGLLLEVAR